LGFKVFIGCSTPKITALASEIADGILFNYVYPEFLLWIKQHLKKKVLSVAFGPALILPSQYYQDLILAAAIVMGSNYHFLEEFNLVSLWNKIAHINLENLIKIRQKGYDLFKLEDFKKIDEISELLVEKFTISGSLNDFKRKINDILKVCDQLILGDPFFRDINSLLALKQLFS